MCSGTPATCVNGTDAYLQVMQVPSFTRAMTTLYVCMQPTLGETYVDVCPLLDQPSPGINYTQPVQLNRNIELVTRNLPPEVHLHLGCMCTINSIFLSAV